MGSQGRDLPSTGTRSCPDCPTVTPLPELSTLDTVRALHETVVVLRSALHKSQEKLKDLKDSSVEEVNPVEVLRGTVEKLALENHVLRERVLTDQLRVQTLKSVEEGLHKISVMASGKQGETQDGEVKRDEPTMTNEETQTSIEETGAEIRNDSCVELQLQPVPKEESVNGLTLEEESEEDQTTTEKREELPVTEQVKTGAEENGKSESDDEDEEVDDIELIFTTDDTKELPTLQETLESITEDGPWDRNGVPVLLKYRTVNEFDPVAEEGPEYCSKHRRNTLPGSREYRPIAHRDVIQSSRSQVLSRGITVVPSGETGPVRPILMERNNLLGVGGNKRESTGAQTDITALPLQWKSESYLARHKVVAQNFTTLPSKFAIPTPSSRPMTSSTGLRLGDKTREARRALLSDLGFTSMVPELSRSVDHLCRRGDAVLARTFPRAMSYMKQIDSADSSLASPAPRNGRWLCECLAHAGSSYYPGMWDSTGSSLVQRHPWSPMTPQTPCDRDGNKRRYTWRTAGATHSAEAYRGATLVREGAINALWGSMPSSPTHQGTTYSGHWALGDDGLGKMSSSSTRSGGSRNLSGFSNSHRSKSRVTFQDCSSVPWHARRSLPDLRCEGHSHRHYGIDSGGSTDSLIDEAEEYLRRSIDSIVTGTDWTRTGQRRQFRRYSEPDPIRDFQPPFSARPFLPRQPRDLRDDCLVKVIAHDGRVLVGRVRFVGTLTAAGVNDPVVGIELPDTSYGNTDGTLHGYRLFDCEPGKAMFVPFKKVILAWSV